MAEIAALMGDAARVNVFATLMSGRALTAGEPAWSAGVSGPTTSVHLSRLVQDGLLAVAARGVIATVASPRRRSRRRWKAILAGWIREPDGDVPKITAWVGDGAVAQPARRRLTPLLIPRDSAAALPAAA